MSRKKPLPQELVPGAMEINTKETLPEDRTSHIRYFPTARAEYFMTLDLQNFSLLWTYDSCVFSSSSYSRGSSNKYSYVLTQPLYIDLMWKMHRCCFFSCIAKESFKSSVGITGQSVLVALLGRILSYLL